MEAEGEAPGSGPLTSTPRAGARPPSPGVVQRLTPVATEGPSIFQQERTAFLNRRNLSLLSSVELSAIGQGKARVLKIVSSSSLNSESSEEDWLIKVCCPGARHRYCRNARFKKPFKIECQQNSDQEDDLTGCTSCNSYQSYPGVLRKESSELDWLIRLRCPGAQMEQRVSDRKQSLPGVPTPIQARRGSLSAREKPAESWLTQKHLSALQAVVSGHMNVGGSPQSLLESENHFMREVDRYLEHNDFLALRRKEMQYKKWFENVSKPLLQKVQDKVDSQSSEEIEERKRKQLSLYLNYCNKQHGAYLESYNPSVYDPFFLKNTDTCKVSVPPLCDPLLRDAHERYLEEEIIQQCDTGRMYSSKEISEHRKDSLPLLPLSRQVMNPIEWLKIPASYVESEIRQKSRNTRVKYRKGKEPEKAQVKERHLASRGSPKTKARNAERSPLSPKRGMASDGSPLPSTLPVNCKGRLSTEDVCPTSLF